VKPSLRFLAVAVLGWAGVRAATLGVIPGAALFKVAPSEAKPAPAVATTQFPPIEPARPMEPSQAYYYPPVPTAYLPQQQIIPVRVQPITVPVYYASVPQAQSRPLTEVIPLPARGYYPQTPALDEWPLSRLASTAMPQRRSEVVAPMQSTPASALVRQGIDRLQVSAWAYLRSPQGTALGPPSLASGGTLGGSQAGARLFYNFSRQIAASLRSNSDVGRRGGEVAGGIRIQPVSGLPIWFTAERRQQLGRGGGRNAFALFAEGGVWQRPLPWKFSLDAYLQGGVVGLRRREAFVDGGLTVTRPVYRQFSAGLGVWGGAQPGVYRLDAGPRVTMAVRRNMRVHFDYRQRIAGNALPGSGPAVTLAGDF